ncbi:MAG: transposase, partial [Clostridiales bacterium]|nr:transposase [Clostridiales bacterium]
RKPISKAKELNSLIITLRKQNFSAEDIVIMIQSKGLKVSYGYVYQLIKKEGFARLPRRSNGFKSMQELSRIEAPVSVKLVLKNETFSTSTAGLLCFLPIIRKYEIDSLIQNSSYPSTRSIGKLSSIMSFLALKLVGTRRYSVDDLWCMDRGSGFFAGLNVLPKNAWFSSYSHRVTREMNVSFLRSMHTVWAKHNLLGDTSNLDFTTIPYWGEHTHLENNWSGKRNKALSSMLAVLAQDPDTGIIDYGNTDVMHKNESNVVLEYLDFYRSDKQAQKLKYLVFDSRFTNYENLSKLDHKGIKFLTIRRRGKKIVDQIRNVERSKWKTIRVDCSAMKKRTLKAYDSTIELRGYCDVNGETKQIRQVAITGNGKVKPALIITNDFDINTQVVVRKYARRWLVEKEISEQVEFFHLNKVSSSMVIKVDFDLTMTILAHNIYRIFANELGRYSSLSDNRIYEKFIATNGQVNVANKMIQVQLKKKRELPLLLETMSFFNNYQYEQFEHRKLLFEGAASS